MEKVEIVRVPGGRTLVEGGCVTGETTETLTNTGTPPEGRDILIAGPVGVEFPG